MQNIFERNVFEIILCKMLASQARTAYVDIGFNKFQLNFDKNTQFFFLKMYLKFPIKILTIKFWGAFENHTK